VQALDEGDVEKNRRNVMFAARVAMAYGYRLSVQMHKLAELA
jgi:organic radical activating enzyme